VIDGFLISYQLSSPFYTTQQQHTTLQQQHATLQQQNNQLATSRQQLSNSQQQLVTSQQQHTTLQQQHTNLQQQYTNLQQQHTNSQQQSNSLQQQLNTVQTQHTSLQQEYTLLEQKYNSALPTIQKLENFNQESKYSQLQDIVNSLFEYEIQSLQSYGFQPLTPSFEGEIKNTYTNFTITTTATIIQKISSIIQKLQQEHENVSTVITSSKLSWANLKIQDGLVTAVMMLFEQNLVGIFQKMQRWAGLKQKLREILQT